MTSSSHAVYYFRAAKNYTFIHGACQVTFCHYKCGIDPLSSENSTTALSAGYIVHGSIRKSAMRQPAFCFASCANAASIFSANTMAIASR